MIVRSTLGSPRSILTVSISYSVPDFTFDTLFVVPHILSSPPKQHSTFALPSARHLTRAPPHLKQMPPNVQPHSKIGCQCLYSDLIKHDTTEAAATWIAGWRKACSFDN
eukprot:588657-Rhodomonas_salina.2